MNQQQFNERLLAKAKPNGWFLTFLLSKLLPFLWNNREELADLFRKDKPVKLMADDIDPEKPKPDPGTTPPAP